MLIKGEFPLVVEKLAQIKMYSCIFMSYCVSGVY